MKKKAINIILLLIVLISLLSFGVNAALGDIFRAGLNPVEGFFSGGWQNYEKTVSFLVFFFLFFSAFLIGMKNVKAFGDKLTRVHITFAFAAAFLSAFIITVSMRFEWVNLKYIAWFLIAVLILFLMYSLLSKIFEKHKFLGFLLALLLTALLLWLIWYLISEGRPLEGLGRVSDVFSRFGKKDKAIPPKPLGAGPPIGREETGAAPGGKPPVTPEGKGWFGRNWWVILIVVALAAGGGVGGYRYRRGIRGIYRRIRINRMLRKRLRGLIRDTLRILSDPNITQQEINHVRNNLNQAIQTINQIVNNM